jgi:hypothetical protein
MILWRAFAVWLILVVAETIHGVFRRLVLEPWMGDLPARQVSVFTGSVLILVLAYLFIDWIGARTKRQLTFVGVMWVVMTLAFEISAGRFMLRYSWERILSDFNLMKGGLLGIGLVLMGLAPRVAFSFTRIRASRAERGRGLPGDEFITQPIDSLTHAVTIRCSRENLWPWLAQMGAGRAGWYSYDFLDNGGRRSASRILPEFQSVSAGTLFPALPGATDGFLVLARETGRFLVLGAPPQDGRCAATWSFALEETDPNTTRLIVRVRVNGGYRLWGLPLWIVRLIHYIMQRKQLLEITRRAAKVGLVSELAAWPGRREIDVAADCAENATRNRHTA